MHELVSFGPVEEDARQQLDRCLDAGGEEARGVLCADHHKGYSMPIGGVLASQSVVMPAGVGYDIACGNCAVRTNITASDLDVKQAMDEIWTTISFGVGRKNDEPIRDAPVFGVIAHSAVPQHRALLDLARSDIKLQDSWYIDAMRTTIDKAGRVVIPAAIRERAGLSPGAELEVTTDELGIRLERVATGPKLVKVGRRLVARPSVAADIRPSVDVAALIEEERNRWP